MGDKIISVNELENHMARMKQWAGFSFEKDGFTHKFVKVSQESTVLTGRKN